MIEVIKMQSRRSNRDDDDEDGPDRGPADYPERSPSDLIEEDKHGFAGRKFCNTCLGGFRSTYDEV
jgi:hypothetical protein